MSFNLFKVWSCNRQKKALILIKENADVCNNLIKKGSKKLEINGSCLVLEKDGTPVEDDEILLLLHAETLLILQPTESWVPSISDTSSSTSATSFASNASTITLINTQDNSASNFDLSLPLPDDNDIIENLNFISNENEVLQILQIDSCDKNIRNYEYAWSSFAVPWHKLPDYMLKACEEGRRDKHIITEIVHIVVNEMRQIKEKIPSKAFKIVAHKMTQKYPKIFLDTDDDGVVLGDGSCTLFLKLFERSSYLNRPHQTKRPRDQTPVTTKKRRLNATAGCSSWEPGTSGCTEKITDKSTKLNSLSDDDPEFLTLHEEMYAELRDFINDVENPPSVLAIKNCWPILFNKKSIEWHFSKVTGVQLNILIENMEKKADKLVQFSKGKKFPQSQDISCKVLTSLMFFEKYFKEDLSKFYYKLEVTDDAEFDKMSLIDIAAPCVIKISNNQLYDLYMEREKVLSCSSFAEAFKLSYALYFVFNLEFPKACSTIFEMVQRYFLKIHPDCGTKSKKLSVSKKKVINLMSKLRDVSD